MTSEVRHRLHDANMPDELDVRSALANPAAYRGRPAEVEVRETHLSWVFLTGARAYKLKKPVVLPFVDYGTPARRRVMCAEEVRLNRRLAPGVYLGVRGVVATEDGLVIGAEADPRAIDYVVEMRRYDEARTMAATLARGELRDVHVAAVGRVLADFHARARRVTLPEFPARVVEREVIGNIEELRTLAPARAADERLLALERFVRAFVSARTSMFEERAVTGRVCEGHGDLRAEHVLLNGTPLVVDCVEFDAGLRELDVADDLAFLVMDLTAGCGARFAAVLVRAYREAGGDAGDDPLIAFYAAHRALVRAKVAFVRGSQHPPNTAPQSRALLQAHNLVVLAQQFTWRARLPLVVVVCGAPASGKSTLATALATESGVRHLCSDLTRKRLAGLAPDRQAAAEHYTEAFSGATYRELGREAAAEARLSGGVIVDATFRRDADRAAFADAFKDAAPVLFVECRAPLAVLERRAIRRDHAGRGASDATREVVLSEHAAWDPLDEVAPRAHLALRTDRPITDIMSDLLALLDLRLGPSRDPGPSDAGTATTGHGAT